jgi:lysophospholipase L1-like esterase
LYETDGFEYPRQLEKFLNASAGDRFQVVNAAYPGLTIRTAIQLVPDVASTLDPHIVVIYAVPANYIWKPAATPAKNTQAAVAPVRRFELRVGERVRVLTKNLLPPSVQSRIRQYEIRRSVAALGEIDRLSAENVDRFREDIEALVAELLRYDIVPVLATHVTAFGAGAAADRLSPAHKDMLTAWRKFYPMLTEAGLLDMETRMNEAVREIAAEYKLPLVDLARDFPPEPEDFGDAVHFTDRGAARIAERLARGLQPVLSTTVKFPLGDTSKGLTSSVRTTAR